MTQDEIIEMLRASCDKDRVDPEQNGFWVIVTEELEHFAKLVAEKEREACAKLFELTDLGGLKNDVWLQNYTATILDGYAKAIRARGQA